MRGFFVAKFWYAIRFEKEKKTAGIPCQPLRSTEVHGGISVDDIVLFNRKDWLCPRARIVCRANFCTAKSHHHSPYVCGGRHGVFGQLVDNDVSCSSTCCFCRFIFPVHPFQKERACVGGGVLHLDFRPC